MKTSKEFFEVLTTPESFQRVSTHHLLDLYCGYDSMMRRTLLLVSTSEPPSLASSKVIDVRVGSRTSDSKWALSFCLTDDTFKELFQQFCDDLISSSDSLENPALGPQFICDRYTHWQDMLSAAKPEALSRSEIKGLIGEMIFLRDVLIPKYGCKEALQAWKGPEKGAQDFVFSNTWYEVKASTSGAEHVLISSIEQLDRDDDGTLAVLALDNTSMLDGKGITINSLARELDDQMTTEELKNTLRSLLLEANYFPRTDYDKYIYRLNGIRQYQVNKSFPCLRRANVNTSVVDASWTLALAAVANWLQE